jgi:transcription elongation factor Elf1
MAKENSVLLHGVALSDATIKVGSDQTPIRAMLYVRIVDRTKSDGNGRDEIQYTTAFIYSGSPKIIEAMREISAGDVVDVYGTLTTAKVPKKRTCPVCNSVNTAQGDVTYVSPMYVCRREQGLSQEEINQLLIKRSEFSNRVYAIGNICAGLDYNDKNGTGNPALRYQLAIPRTIRVHDDTANDATDYPWVLATGHQALEGKDALRVGSVVYIKGHLRSKDQMKEIQCSSCGSVFTSPDFPLMRISPHFTEYLHNCNFPDSMPTKYE